MIPEIRALVAETASLAVPLEQLPDDADLYQAGMSSFEAVSLIVALEKRFAVRFPQSAMRPDNFSSVAAIADAIAAARA